MRKGDKKGYPIIDAEKGDVPPDGTKVYDATTSVTTFKTHMTKPHAEMPFLRAAPLNDAIEYVRNEGHAPVQVTTYQFCLRAAPLNYAIEHLCKEGYYAPVRVSTY